MTIATAPITPPGIGDSQRALLEALKRRGESTLADLEASGELAAETVRSHLQALVAQGLVVRSGLLRSGPGRPRIRYRLSPEGDALFPRRDRELLRELATFLLTAGHGPLLEAFFAERLRRKRAEAEARLSAVAPGERLEAVARLLSEEGFLAEVVADAAGRHLRLYHCPLRDLVEISHLPCRAEMALVEDLLGEDLPAGRLRRETFIPDGAPACTYAVGPAEAPRARSTHSTRPHSNRPRSDRPRSNRPRSNRRGRAS